MNNGYIKLYRCMLDNPIIMQDNDHIAVWVYLLLKATHKNMSVMFDGKRIELQAGQLISGRKKIASDLNMNESKAKRILYELENDQQIGRVRGSKNSLFTILNWDKYQESGQVNGQQMDNKWTADGQVVDNSWTGSGHKQECNNVKNDKNVKNVRSKKADEPLVIPDTLTECVKICVNYFIEYRRNDKKKPMTQRAVDMLVKQLLEMPNDAVRINSIEHSIACGYQGVFEYAPKSNTPKQPTYESPLSYYRRQAEKGGNDGEVFEGRCEETDSDDELPFS